MQNLKNYWNKFNYFLLFVSILFSPIFTHNSYSDNLHQGNKIIQEMITEAQKHALKTIGLSSEERSKKITPLINQYINLDFMAKATTGSFWKKATDDQKTKYKLVLLHQIVNTIEDHLNALATMSYKPLSSELRGKKLIYVRGIIEDKKKNNPPINLLWKLSKGKDKKFSILDLEIEGISLVRSHKSETTSILRKNKGDFNHLIEKLKIKK
jgi:phospholipid transport system substrate-binding protein